MSLLDKVDKVLADQRNNEAKIKGCFAFHPPAHAEMKHVQKSQYTQANSRFSGHARSDAEETSGGSGGGGCFMFQTPTYAEMKHAPERQCLQAVVRFSDGADSDAEETLENLWDGFQERAAIMRYDGNRAIEDVEKAAFIDCLRGLPGLDRPS